MTNVSRKQAAVYREMKKAEYRANIGIDCGAKGRIFELECARENSRKYKVSKQGQVDNWIIYNGKRASAEAKTNGGRIASLRKGKVQFVIYQMDFIQKHKASKSREAWEEKRVIEPVIIPREIFLAVLDKFGATKSTNGRNPEEAIQVSSKKFYEWLTEWPVEYHNDWDYTEEDFEGLGI